METPVVCVELTQRSCKMRFLHRLKTGHSRKVGETSLKRPYKTLDKSRVLTSEVTLSCVFFKHCPSPVTTSLLKYAHFTATVYNNYIFFLSGFLLYIRGRFSFLYPFSPRNRYTHFLCVTIFLQAPSMFYPSKATSKPQKRLTKRSNCVFQTAKRQ